MENLENSLKYKKSLIFWQFQFFVNNNFRLSFAEIDAFEPALPESATGFSRRCRRESSGNPGEVEWFFKN